jgi:hypothetical protein
MQHPLTNGMVERFNGRIEDVLQSHHFRSDEELETTLLCGFLQRAATAISLGQQDPLAGDEGMAQAEVRVVQETALQTSWM